MAEVSDSQLEAQLEPQPSRYLVGVDLGTTNSAVAYVDSHERPWRVQTFAVPQLVAAGEVESRETLPSFHYQPAQGEVAASQLRLPWSREDEIYAVGLWARQQGQLAPGRLVASAKSWLCHSGVDRTADLLPWHGADDVARISPVEASARYLLHMRRAWNERFPNDPLEQQDFTLTLPASFDEVARELTVQAAARAGLPRVVLIEEPQAAFYAWLNKHAPDWQTRVTPGQTILVCDVGGGTSDFTLIRARAGDDGRVQFHRVAVGEHLILGGDNMDLALAHFVETKCGSPEKLDGRRWDILVRSCRHAKETLLGETPPERLHVQLSGGGARLLGGGLQVELTRSEVSDLLVEGFFPRVGLRERPANRRSGFQEFGLPYASDAAITRHLAAFLVAHAEAGTANAALRPDVLLLNGGVFASIRLRQRLVEVLGDWFTVPGQPRWQPLVLDHERLDVAVARGAAYFGMVRRGEGVRIRAELARTYYLGLASDPPTLLCLVPADAEPGTEIEVPQRSFELLVSQPVEFALYVSSTRLTDRPGQLIPFDPEQVRALPPIRTVLRVRRKGEEGAVRVALHARLTEIGTIEMWCQEAGGERSWRMQFDVRSATQTNVAAHAGGGEREGVLEESAWQAGANAVAAVLLPEGTAPPDTLPARLQEAFQLSRGEWPMPLLRRVWDLLFEHASGRGRSPQHEARWLNLLGYALRPGYGCAVDDWRVAETWKLLAGKRVHATPACRAEGWILWRRVAGGLSAGQQRALIDPVLAPLRAWHKRLTTGKGGSEATFAPQELAEIVRLLGTLEHLPPNLRTELGQLLLDLLGKRQLATLRPALAWSLGRLGGRVPVYGPLNTVVAGETVARWLEQLLPQLAGDSHECLAVMQLARFTGDRHRDLPAPLRQRAAQWLREHASEGHLALLVESGGSLASEEQERVFGEALPRGLRLL